MAVLSGAIAAPLQEPSLQEALAYINTLHSQEVSNGKLKDLYEALLRRGGEDIEDDALLQAKIIEFLQAHDLQNKADKRASYMSLCHFKICNMGRKRTLWPRN
uniref:Neuropeptide n=1 Tax=Nezara viridula TaxID=85310 RepID=A0A451ENL9_NEZVI|nr:neuropeptide precursor [Nezara viridula]